MSPLYSYHHLFFTALAFIISTFLLLLLHNKAKSKLPNLPPGPPGWPIVGNLFQFARSGKPLHEYIDELKQKYGPIFSLKMGARKMIIISDAKLVQEALIERGAIFASRPALTPTREIFGDDFTVNAAPYGPEWRSLRRNMVQNMLGSNGVKEFQAVREKVMDGLIDRIKLEASDNHGAVRVLKNVRFAFFSILLTMSFGIVMEEETIQKIDEMMKSVLITLVPTMDDYLPILYPIYIKERKRAIKVRKEQIGFLLPFIERRKMAIKNPGSDKSATSFSYLDTLFDLKIEGRKSSPSNEELVTLVSELLHGGTDTTGTMMEWAIARLIANPNIQSKLYDEIRSTVGGDRKVDEKDLEKMSYLQAVLKELLRKHPPTYFSLTHAVTEATTLGGYYIPTDVNVEFYIRAINEDPKIWDNPQIFDPDRFVSEKDGVDITGVKGVKMMPFGVGRRICPGLSLGTVHLSLMLARLVQEFEWNAHPADGEIDFTETMEFTMVMKNTLRAMIKPRV